MPSVCVSVESGVGGGDLRWKDWNQKSNNTSFSRQSFFQNEEIDIQPNITQPCFLKVV